MARFDGRPADVDATHRIMPFVMKGRAESVVYFEQTLDVSKAQDWLKEWNTRGGAKATLFHLVLFGLARMLHERPHMNRFIAGRKVYDRDGVHISFVAKKQMTAEAPLATIKREFDLQETFEELVNGLFGSVTDARTEERSGGDAQIAQMLRLPGPLLDGALATLRQLDAWGVAPKGLLESDPLYTSVFVSNLGSIKLDSAYHHLYEYGNCPLFVVIGQVKKVPAVAADGVSVEVRPTVSLRYTYDERIEDGLYAGSSLEIVRRVVEDPATCIDTPLDIKPPVRQIPRSPMRQVDQMGAVYLAAEDSRTTTHTAALITLDPGPDGELSMDHLRELVAGRLHLIPPFRWKLVPVPLGVDHAYFAEDPHFDLDFHLRELALPAPGSDEQLKDQVARLFSRPLDRTHPLWEMYLIHGLEGGRFALLTKMHHAIVDGISGAEILGTLLSNSPDVVDTDAPVAMRAPKPIPGEWEMLGRGLLGLTKRSVKSLATAPAVLANIEELPLLGTLPGANLMGRAASAFAGKQAVGVDKPTVGKAPRTSFNGRISAQRRIGFATLGLEDVKTVKSSFGVTVNDVVMAVSAGAVRRWLLEHHELPGEALHAVVPVSVRTKEESGTYGNKVTAIVVPIPTQLADPRERVRQTHEAMRAAKDYHHAVPANLLQDATQFFPPALLAQATRAMTGMAARPGATPAMNLNISNVPGPQKPLYCAGARVETMVPLAGISDGMGINITVMSYCGRIDIGIVADREQVPDVQRIADWMSDDLAVLVKLAQDSA